MTHSRSPSLGHYEYPLNHIQQTSTEKISNKAIIVTSLNIISTKHMFVMMVTMSLIDKTE